VCVTVHARARTQITSDTPIIDALAKFLEKRVSALPVVDENGRLIDIYAKFDVINLAAEGAYNHLDTAVSEALRKRSNWFEGVHHGLETDSLASVMETLVKAEVHRLVITDKDKQVRGIVSLSDILTHLVLEHSRQTTTACSCPRSGSSSAPPVAVVETNST